jgi:hypothetical protein
MASEYLDRDDVPETVALLNALLGNRASPPKGYAAAASGVEVDWDLLVAAGGLSTSEQAAVHIAHGLALLERHGGRFELRLRDQILAAVQTIVEVP